jgi:ABC-type transporter Mla maintaining outer membrane lipid asymmetry ATPase subunit MlaF
MAPPPSEPLAFRDVVFRRDGRLILDRVSLAVSSGETVALLGDGSSKAGAKRLDQFRANIRKQKGSALAKGKFSPDAKRPEQYLMGGRA